jgi:phage host-nuclease inhibitor protein Gam
MSKYTPDIPFDRPDEELEAQVPEHFEVRDEQTANWLVRRVLESRAYADRVQAWCDSEKRRARREEDFFVGRFGLQIERWLRDELEKRGGRSKSVTMPAGRVGLRSVGPKLEVLDLDVVLAWAREHCPEAIKQTESLRKTPLNDHFEATGELPDGVYLQSPRDDFYIR